MELYSTFYLDCVGVYVLFYLLVWFKLDRASIVLFKIIRETRIHMDEELLDNGANSESLVEIIETAICKITTSC